MPSLSLTAALRRQLLAGLISTTAFLATGSLTIDSVASAATTDLPISHIAADKFPDLKTKVFYSNFALTDAAGNAVMRSRYGTDNSGPGDKVYVYGYQLDLKESYGVTGSPAVRAITLDLPVVPELVTAPKVSDEAKVYVIDGKTGDGGIDVQSAALVDGKLVFTFATPVKAGKGPGNGQHSLWFGLISSARAKHGQVILSTAPVDAKKAVTPTSKPADPLTLQVFLPVPDTAGN